MKQTLMLDLDDVITDGSWKQQIEEFLGEKIDLEKTGYFLENALGNRKKEYFDSLDDINMYKGVELREHAYEVIKKLNEKYELYLVSSYALADVPDRTGEHLKNKYDFIYRYLPFITQEQIIFSNCKTKMKFDIGIDDKLSNLTNCNTKLLYRQWHNTAITKENCSEPNTFIVNNWEEIANILLGE